MPAAHNPSTVDDDVPQSMRAEDHRSGSYHLRHNRRLIITGENMDVYLRSLSSNLAFFTL